MGVLGLVCAIEMRYKARTSQLARVGKDLRQLTNHIAMIFVIAFMSATAIAQLPAKGDEDSLIGMIDLSQSSAGTPSDHPKCAIELPSNLGFTPTSVSVEGDLGSKGLPMSARLIPSPTTPQKFCVEVSVLGSLTSRMITAQVKVSGGAILPSGVTNGAEPIPLATKQFACSILVKAAHHLYSTNSANHVYIFNGVAKISEFLLGLQESPDNFLRIRVENDTALDSAVSSAHAVLSDANGTPAGSQLQAALANSSDRDAVVSSTPIPESPSLSHGTGLAIPNHGSRIVTVDLEPAKLTPGTYSGTLYIDADSPATTTTLPFKLDVRSHPIWVTLAMIMGTLAGYMVYWLKQPRQGYVEQLESMRASLLALKAADLDSIARSAVELMEWHWRQLCIRTGVNEPSIDTQVVWKRTKNWFPRADPSLDTTLAADLATLRSALHTAEVLRGLSTNEDGEDADRPLSPTALGQLDDAWKSIALLDVTQAAATLKQIESTLFFPQPEVQSVAVISALAVSTATPMRSVKEMSVQIAKSKKISLNPLKGQVRRIQLIRCAATFVATSLLFLSGLYTLYIAVPGFGHSAFDYVKAITWGFAAGAGGKGLSSTLTTWASSLVP